MLQPEKAWSGAGFKNINLPQSINFSFLKIVREILKYTRLNKPSGMLEYNSKYIEPNNHDAKILRKWLEIYYEFPPIFKKAKTRWGDIWNELEFPTPDAILRPNEKALFLSFMKKLPSTHGFAMSA